MKRLYLEIERTYMDSGNYPEAVRTEDAHFHQTREMAWKFLGTAERMASWAGILDDAKAAAASDEEKARVAAFEKYLWGRMIEGRKQWETKAGK